ncbi:MAG: pyrroline-5-carboxylate reductase [Spirochaetes bacterium]|nr:pyrroline-5-carboxylate reductase [Spirochaetota bacterium]
MENIGIIGFGNMGESFVAGLRTKFPEITFAVVEKLSSRAKVAIDRYSAMDCTGDWVRFFSHVDIVILAVKPQDAESLLREISPYSQGKRFISIMAGKQISFLQKYLQTSYISRFMPNLAAMYGKAVIGVSFPEGSSAPSSELESFKTACLQIAEAVGKPIPIPERLMPMMTGLSASGIAFVFQFIHAMALGGVKTGLGYPSAVEATLQVVEGAVEVLRKTGEIPSAWITRVTSPAGTTIEGLQVLEETAFTAAVMGAVEAASRRAKELEGV